MNLLDDDEDDEDYNEFDDSTEKKSGENFTTRLDLQDEVVYLRDILNYLSVNNNQYYCAILNSLNDSVKYELNRLFETSNLNK